jgi:hypothetical protein
LHFALAAPDDATDMVFDQNRPYLNLNTAGTIDATRDFYSKQLVASGWMPLSAADAATKWPNAKLDGALAYYDRGNKRPIMLSMQPAATRPMSRSRLPPSRCRNRSRSGRMTLACRPRSGA